MSPPRQPLSAQAQPLLQRFRTEAGGSRRELQTLGLVIRTSPLLARRIDQTINTKVLHGIKRLRHPNAAGEFQDFDQAIYLSSEVLSSPGMTALVLGHEVHHALTSKDTVRADRHFRREIRRAAETHRDYTDAIASLINSIRRNEATAELAGWNSLVDHVRGVHGDVTVNRLLGEAEKNALSDFVTGSGASAQMRAEFTVNRDFTIDPTPANVAAIARRFFDKDAEQTRLGGRGTADYANYYAAIIVGDAAQVHSQRNPGQPMRLDLRRLGLSRELMEESGIALPGRRPQPYVDGSTRPPTRGVFHHTAESFVHIPRSPSGGQDQRLGAARLAHPGIRLPTIPAGPWPAEPALPTGRRAATRAATQAPGSYDSTGR